MIGIWRYNSVMSEEFKPVPGIWRFHFIYLVVMLIMAWGAHPFPVFTSLLLVGAVCVAGLLLAQFRQELATHMVATVVGLSSPIIFFAQLGVWVSLGVIAVLSAGIILFRKWLF
jgi:hypothetical protein